MSAPTPFGDILSNTSIDAKHYGASLSERYITWMGTICTLNHNSESIAAQCYCFVHCMQVCKFG